MLQSCQLQNGKGKKKENVIMQLTNSYTCVWGHVCVHRLGTRKGKKKYWLSA
jgi:hypothetical protein